MHCITESTLPGETLEAYLGTGIVLLFKQATIEQQKECLPEKESPVLSVGHQEVGHFLHSIL